MRGSRGPGHLCHTHIERGWGSQASKMSRFLLLLLCSIPALTFVSGQNDCPLLQGSELGNSQNANMAGLIADTLVTTVSQPPARPSVQVLGYNIVCQTTGMQRNTFRSVSVVVNYTCDGISWAFCDGTPLLSQFEFECGTGNAWIPGEGGSTVGAFTEISDGDLSTPLRADCGTCISPLRTLFGSITNNSNHCGGNPSACSNVVRSSFSLVFCVPKTSPLLLSSTSSSLLPPSFNYSLQQRLQCGSDDVLQPFVS